jgi:hypothetical protein
MLYTHCLYGAKFTLHGSGNMKVHTATATAAAVAATQCYTRTALMVRSSPCKFLATWKFTLQKQQQQQQQQLNVIHTLP